MGVCNTKVPMELLRVLSAGFWGQIVAFLRPFEAFKGLQGFGKAKNTHFMAIFAGKRSTMGEQRCPLAMLYDTSFLPSSSHFDHLLYLCFRQRSSKYNVLQNYVNTPSSLAKVEGETPKKAPGKGKIGKCSRELCKTLSRKWASATRGSPGEQRVEIFSRN